MVRIRAVTEGEDRSRRGFRQTPSTSRCAAGPPPLMGEKLGGPPS
jgi:hypothetical protein